MQVDIEPRLAYETLTSKLRTLDSLSHVMDPRYRLSASRQDSVELTASGHLEMCWHLYTLGTKSKSLRLRCFEKWSSRTGDQIFWPYPKCINAHMYVASKLGLSS